MEAAVAVARPGTRSRWAFLGGLAYVVLFVIGTIVLFGGAPDTSSAPGKVIQWYSDSGHRDRVTVGWVLIGLAVFFLLWFIGALRQAVSAVDGDGVLTAVVGIGGTVYAALAFGAVAVNQGLRTTTSTSLAFKKASRWLNEIT